MRDIVYAFRMMGKSPGFTAIALLTLVLGIGATTAIFSVVNAVLLRPLPYAEPDRLVHVLANDPTDSRAGVAYDSAQAARSQNRTFRDLAVYYRNTGWSRVILGGAVDPQPAQAGFVTGNFFTVLGVNPVLGHAFNEDDEAHQATVAVLSDGLWKQSFGGDPAVLGKAIDVDGRAFTIIGVMPREFQLPAAETRLWLPITTNRYWPERPQPDGVHVRGYFMRWNLVGRLRPGISAVTAVADLTAIGNFDVGLRVVPLGVEITGNARLALLVLFASSSLVLLIACGNVANLMLARGAARAREFAIRSALGATGRRIRRQVFVESMMLVVLAASFGALLATVATRLLVAFGPADLPRLSETRTDGVVLCFTLGVAIASVLVFGMLPALRAGRMDPIHALKMGVASATYGHGGRLLVISEVTLAVVLLSGAGLLLRSLQKIAGVDLGFRTNDVLTMRVRLPNGTPPNRQAAFQNVLQERLSAMPGVRFAGGIGGLFELDRPPGNSLREVEGQAIAQDRSMPLTWTTVSGNYFQAMGIPLLAGRLFSERDTAHSPLVAIIDQGMAQRYWPDANAIGKRFKGQDKRGQNDEWLTVIGIVRSTRRQGVEQDPTPHVYEWSDQAGATTDWVIRTAGSPAAVNLEGYLQSVRAAVRQTDRTSVISGLGTMSAQIDLQTATRRFRTWLLSLFAALAVFLAAAGIYGTISYATTQRTREFGIRIALGAQTAGILGMVLRQGLTMASIGLTIGLLISLALTRLMSGLLFGITSSDALTYTGVAVALLVVAATATLLPAVRAARVEPSEALRAD